ncbi:MAG TPA: hypothetical protein VFN44_05265, partial [Solirubrobacteraceae bacterium]|nr:hypothetical protein [Solirubrobacteraceae bacterium]
HGFAEMGVGAFRIAALVMPLAAMSLSLSRTLRMGVRGVAGWSRGSVQRRIVAVGGAVGAVAVIAFIWWPNGDYQPIRPGEKGTITEAVKSVSEIPSGRPSLSTEQAARFASEPTERERLTPRGVAPHDGEDGGGDGLTSPAPGASGEPAPGDDDVTSGKDPSTGAEPGTDDATDPAAAPEATTTPAGGTAPAGDTAPSGTAAPEQSGTATPSPSATATPTPTPTATATPSPTTAPTDNTAITGPAVTPDATALESEPTPLPTP